MPLRDEETLFGLVCKIYDDGLVKVGTNTERFILRLKPGEDLEQRLRAQLIKRGWSAEDLPEDATVPLQQASPESEQQQPDPEQPAAESTVLFGSTRCGLKRQMRPGERNEEVRGLATDLGKAWEFGKPAHMAEHELAKVSRAHCELLAARNAARQDKIKRGREESKAQAAGGKEPCLCTRDGTEALLRESQQQTREALALASQNGRIATGLTSMLQSNVHAWLKPAGGAS